MVGWFVEALMRLLRRTGVKRILKKLPAGKRPQSAHQGKKATMLLFLFSPRRNSYPALSSWLQNFDPSNTLKIMFSLFQISRTGIITNLR